ncbi:MAG: hypothetical protein G01um101418_207 [Parcubacteria group bacterium Gr01-1014_18]|nr:MAG: hypothetical protein Greene041636_175 [Parcubacteria group bacterium Greene0416_36]TSC81367.1 MAG: hypothetical protein G01um101418_207 [Parcubacteria group bacterium Gr01-1014_18]TSC99447.1 MAG: hypothetical protein Greene101420_114 [Parcubacteria group bacterium Greene1014_20]TSD07634.1 MAG: hypothetical protein Greene07142_91 [Parcubacteria group bacterium Greene0714_2]
MNTIEFCVNLMVQTIHFLQKSGPDIRCPIDRNFRVVKMLKSTIQHILNMLVTEDEGSLFGPYIKHKLPEIILTAISKCNDYCPENISLEKLKAQFLKDELSKEMNVLVDHETDTKCHELKKC